MDEALDAVGAQLTTADANRLKSVVLRAQGLYPQATQLLHALIESNPDEVWAHWLLGKMFVEKASITDAIKHLEKVAGHFKTFAPAQHQLGLAYATQKRFENAVRLLQMSIKNGGGHRVERDLGRIFIVRKMWAEALAPLENSLAGGSGPRDTIRMIAAAQFHLKKYQVAVDTYLKAYAIEPEPRTLYPAAIAHHAGKAYGSALSLLGQIAPFEGQIPEIRYQRALLIGREKTVEARRQLEVCG